MATLANANLSLDEFRKRYAEEKPYYEYWFGEAVQKSVPTVLHSLLVRILLTALVEAGYRCGPELELRIDPAWQPKADVAAWTKPIEGPYPTTPIDIVVEVLSPEDRMQRVLAKCKHYERIGIAAIFVMDPESQDSWAWNGNTQNLDRIDALSLPNGKHISAKQLWLELQKESG